MRRAYWLVIVRNFLKYFIPIIIVAISFIANIEESYSATAEESNAISTEQVLTYSDSYELESEFYLPPQSLSSVTFRQNTSKRVNNNHRHNIIFIREGIPTSYGYDTFVSSTSLTSKFSFTKSFQRLISFGKLII